MNTITVKVPDEVATRWQGMPEEERNLSVLIALADEFYQDQFSPTSQEDLEAIGRGLADADAGRVVDGETFFAELEAMRQSLKVVRK